MCIHRVCWLTLRCWIDSYCQSSFPTALTILLVHLTSSILAMIDPYWTNLCPRIPTCFVWLLVMSTPHGFICGPFACPYFLGPSSTARMTSHYFRPALLLVMVIYGFPHSPRLFFHTILNFSSNFHQCCRYYISTPILLSSRICVFRMWKLSFRIVSGSRLEEVHAGAGDKGGKLYILAISYSWG